MIMKSSRTFISSSTDRCCPQGGGGGAGGECDRGLRAAGGVLPAGPQDPGHQPGDHPLPPAGGRGQAALELQTKVREDFTIKGKSYY